MGWQGVGLGRGRGHDYKGCFVILVFDLTCSYRLQFVVGYYLSRTIRIRTKNITLEHVKGLKLVSCIEKLLKFGLFLFYQETKFTAFLNLFKLAF